MARATSLHLPKLFPKRRKRTLPDLSGGVRDGLQPVAGADDPELARLGSSSGVTLQTLALRFCLGVLAVAGFLLLAVYGLPLFPR